MHCAKIKCLCCHALCSLQSNDSYGWYDSYSCYEQITRIHCLSEYMLYKQFIHKNLTTRFVSLMQLTEI